MRSDPPPRQQTPRILFHHRTDVAPGEGLPPAVEEQWTSGRRPPWSAVRPTRTHPGASIAWSDIGTSRSLSPFPRTRTRPRSRSTCSHGEAGHLADAQPRSVQQLQDGAIAQQHRSLERIVARRRRRRLAGASASSAASRGRRTVGSRFTTFGEPSSADGSVSVTSAVERPAVERADGADAPRDRCARVAQRVLLRQESSKLRVAGGRERRAAACEERGEPRQVPAVRADRVIGEMPFVTEMRGERLDQPLFGRGELVVWGVTGSFRSGRGVGRGSTLVPAAGDAFNHLTASARACESPSRQAFVRTVRRRCAPVREAPGG